MRGGFVGNPDFWGSSWYYSVLILSGILLLTMGPVLVLFRDIPFEWSAIVAIFCIVVTIHASIITRSTNPIQSAFNWLCVVSCSFIFLISLMHAVDMYTVNKYIIINVMAETVGDERRSMLAYSFLYLLFPFLLILHGYIFLRVNLKSYTKLTIGVFLVSIGFVCYQRFVDPHFLNIFPLAATQASGLCTDPNALSMCSFLLIILLVAIFPQTVTNCKKAIIVVLITILAWVMSVAGGRSMVGGLFIFLILLPTATAIAHYQWNMSKRILVSLLTLVLLISSILSIPFLVNTLEKFGTSGKRLVSTYHKYEEKGLSSLLSDGELRGDLFNVAVSLIERAPIAGWGPGGYYREYPNQVFIEKQLSKPAPDMVLNHYLMMAVDFGVPLFLLNLLLLLSPIAAACYCLRYEQDVRQRMVILVMVFGNCAFLLMISMIPPSYYPEVIWLWTGQLAFLFTYSTRKINRSILIFTKNYKISAIATIGAVGIFILIGAYETSFGNAGYQQKVNFSWWPMPPFDYNDRCYLPDVLEDGGSAQWCRTDSSLQIPLTSYDKNEVTVHFDNQFPDLKNKPVVLEYGGMAGLHSRITLQKKGLHSITVPLDADHIYKYKEKSGEEKRFLVLKLNPSRTWIPRDYGIPDERELGVFVLIPKL